MPCAGLVESFGSGLWFYFNVFCGKVNGACEMNALMGNYLNIGNAGFQAVRRGLYVDKSGMIAFLNETLGTMDKLTCVSRPRRFGKSFAAKMLCAYYDKSCDSRELFADLKIAKAPSFEAHLPSSGRPGRIRRCRRNISSCCAACSRAAARRTG